MQPAGPTASLKLIPVQTLTARFLAMVTPELDYTEQTSWILFLKYLDDLEQERALAAELVSKPYSFVIDKQHRWSKWTAHGNFDHDKALTGDDLIATRHYHDLDPKTVRNTSYKIACLERASDLSF
jgi:hypothetical protein